MNLDPKAIADGGAVVILILGIIGIVVGAIRGDWVPGWIYRGAIARAEKAEAVSEGSIEAVKEVARTVREANERRTGEAGGGREPHG